MRYLTILAAASLGAAAPLAAQGTLSTQGYGYPLGQLSARARAMGGSLGELDPISPLNPAALGTLERPGVYFEYGPEFRHVLAPGATDDATVTRFPLVAATMPVGARFMLGVSVSSLLDRTWRTTSRIPLGEGADTATGVVSFKASGALNEVRLGTSYRVNPTLLIGIGLQALAGESRTERQLDVTDSSQFTPALERREFGFSGHGVSAGLVWQPVPALALGASARTGGGVSAYINDSTVARGGYPRRAGASLQFSGVSGIVFAARADWEGWSRMAPLSQTGTPSFDTWDVSAGLEGKGPTLFGAELPLRAGVMHRTLPFGLPDGSKVTETGYSAGAGAPMAGGRAFLDLTVQRLMRRASGTDVKENAWVLGLGFLVRL